MIVVRVERHIIVNNKIIDDLCFKSKNLYNYCNYILRNCYFQRFDNISEFKDLIKSFTIKKTGNTFYMVDEYKLSKELSKMNQVDFRALPIQTSQQIIKQLYKNWKSYFKAVKVYYVNSEKFNGKPKIPRYKKKQGRNIVIFTNQEAKLKDNFIYFPKKVKLEPLKTKVDNIQHVRIIPQASCYIIEVVYKKETEINENLDENLYLSVDLGINNLITAVDNTGRQPFIVNGKTLKSINQYWNKKKARLMNFVGSRGTSNRINKCTFKRNNKVNDYLHKASRFIINYCNVLNIKNIVIGYNLHWKQDINIGKVNNQKFVNIPYLKLIQMIEYKAEEVGINVIRHEESYTSKCDSLVCEEIKKHETYSGKRKKRGLFQSVNGKLINADINGALNILRKVVNDSFIEKIIDRGLVYNPIKISVF